ncbi:MAG: restriction endonuclease subunit [Flaviaesturariibacter sp.]|nr:restriction endonuclease subunit [Flaviaesturariibacter sp.]
MIEVRFPEPHFRMKKEGGKDYIFDAIRKSWILLTEEEWVRQNFVNYLVSVLHYPATLIALEKELVLNGLKKRFDVLIYNAAHQPWMLIECKAPTVSLGESVLQQALRYTMTVPVSYVVITNGSYTIGWKKEGGALKEIHALPSAPGTTAD